MRKNFKNSEKNLQEFYDKIDNIMTTSQDKFAHEIEDLTYDNAQKFRNLLIKELNSIFKNIHSQNLDILKSSLISYAVNSNFIAKKGEAALMRSLLNAVEHTIKNL